MKDTILARFITAALIAAIIGGSWDVWWHSNIGRDTFWEPPHLLLYTAVVAAIVAGLYGWRKLGDTLWRRLAIILLIVPLSAPFDELWHRIFGVEELTSPLVIWSPPHVALILAITASLLLLLPILRKDSDITARRFFSGFALAGALSMLLLLTAPLAPTGPYEVLGWYGPGAAAAVLAGVLIFSQRWLPGIARASLVVLLMVPLLIIQMSEGGSINADIIIQPHDHPPLWLTIFSFLIPAVAADLMYRRPEWLRGAVIGVLLSGILYGFSAYFFKPEFQYSLGNTLTAVISSLVAGAVVGLLVSKVRLTSKSA